MEPIAPENRPVPPTRLNDRIGKFSVSLETIRNQIEDCLPVFTDVVIVQAVTEFHHNIIEYHGFSEHFDPCPIGTEIPEYFPHFTKIQDKESGEVTVIVEWIKKDYTKVFKV